ncbi:MAG: M13 family metallopeptidase [Bacteroidales bacterium]|nr:M13 family metallopeptidase [Bacteroidales bacterium]MBN2749316.1 M13 family metallopeptidase [Bacteroidales bacterium]
MKQLFYLMTAVAFAAIAFSSCESKKGEKTAFDPKQMDLSVKPGVDFYEYVNGTWMKNTVIPDDKSRYGSFDILQEENNKILKSIFEKAASKTDAPKGSSWQKVGDFYASGMDTTAIEQLGVNPIQDNLNSIAAIANTSELQKEIALLHTIRVSPLFFVYAGQDDKQSDQIIVNLYQGGLGLPDRDYYLSPDPRSITIREGYQNHLAQVFKLLNQDEAQAALSADAVMQIESRLAKASMTRLERRDPNKTYNKVSLQEMQSIAPAFDWNAYFTNISIDVPSDFVIDNPAFFAEVSKMLTELPIDSWKTYLTWNLVNRFSPYLSASFVEQQFSFYGKVLSGSQTNKPRWERVAGSANMALGEAIGQVYVEENFPPQAKEKMVTLVANLKDAYRERIQNLIWMSEVTKQKAIDKLNAMNVKVGYPDKWTDYTNLEIDRDSYAANIKRSLAFSFRKNMDKLGKPVDRDEWFMNPQTVNAYYSPSMNEIVFPAGILQPPFFSLYADDAINYGGIGVVIGHEMTHGFDDQGRLYSKEGNLEEWWTPEDAEKFKALTQPLIDQYNAFIAIDSMHLDGNLTLGENIADYGGLTIAYHAFRKSLEGNNEPSPIDGFTANQRFFLSYGNIWRQVIRDEELMRRVKEDVHSPGRFRVNGALFNIPEFYQAFTIEPTEPLYIAPEKRATIW